MKPKKAKPKKQPKRKPTAKPKAKSATEIKAKSQKPDKTETRRGFDRDDYRRKFERAERSEGHRGWGRKNSALRRQRKPGSGIKDFEFLQGPPKADPDEQV
jgi:hypothetical protein